MLFKEYIKVRKFPKTESTKINTTTPYLSSVLYFNLCIMLKIYLNVLYMDNQMNFIQFDKEPSSYGNWNDKDSIKVNTHFPIMFMVHCYLV